MRLGLRVALLALLLAGCSGAAPAAVEPEGPLDRPLLGAIPLDVERAVLESNGTTVIARIDLNEAAWKDGQSALIGLVVQTPENVTASLLVATRFPGRPGGEVEYSFRAFPAGKTTPAMRALTYGANDGQQPEIVLAFASHGGNATLSVGLAQAGAGSQQDWALRILDLPRTSTRPDHEGPQLQAGTAWQYNATAVGDQQSLAGAMKVDVNLEPLAVGLEQGITTFHGAIEASVPGVIAAELYFYARPFYGRFDVSLATPDGLLVGGGPLVQNAAADGDFVIEAALEGGGFPGSRCKMQRGIGTAGPLGLDVRLESQAQGEERTNPATGTELASIRIVTWGFIGANLTDLYRWPSTESNDCEVQAPQ